MAEQVKFDYSLTAGVISEDEMKAMEKMMTLCIKLKVKKDIYLLQKRFMKSF